MKRILNMLFSVWLVCLGTVGTMPSFAKPSIDYDNKQSIRDRIYQLERALDIAGVRSGMIVGEVGAGKGYYTFKLSKRVGPTGKVYANDILEENALEILRRRAREEGLENIEAIQGTEVDPRLPKGLLEMVFFVDAFHDINKPIELLGNLVASLKSGATVVIVDEEAKTPEPPKKNPSDERIYTRQEFLDIIAKSPFKVDRIDTSLPKHTVYILSIK